LIVSDLEGFVLMWLLAAIVDAHDRGALDAQLLGYVDELTAWLYSPGVTPRARAEMDCGMKVRKV